MLVPVGQPISVPVEVICIGAPPLRVLRGHLRRYDRRTYDVELEDAGAEIPAGTRVVLNLSTAGSHRVRGVVISARPGRIHAREQAVSPPEKRSFPRLLGATRCAGAPPPPRWITARSRAGWPGRPIRCLTTRGPRRTR